MDSEAFETSIRKFLKYVGVSSQREIEAAVSQALAEGRLKGNETLPASMTLRLPGAGLEVKLDGEIRLE